MALDAFFLIQPPDAGRIHCVDVESRIVSLALTGAEVLRLPRASMALMRNWFDWPRFSLTLSASPLVVPTSFQGLLPT